MPDLDFYTGAYTGAQIDQRLSTMTIKVSGTITSQNKRINDTRISAAHVVTECFVGNPYVQGSKWTVNTYAGYLEIVGTVTGSTPVTFMLGLT